MLIQCVTITKNLPNSIITCINSILNQSYTNFTYDLYIVTELDSEEFLYQDLLASFANDNRLKYHFISNLLPYNHFEKSYNHLYIEINPTFIYHKSFFEYIINDFTQTDNSIIHYLPTFYICEDNIKKNNKSNLACTVINKSTNIDKSDIKYTNNLIGQDIPINDPTKIYFIDNKYCGIYWFNHPKWQSYVYLNKRNNRAYNINNNDHGKYEHIDDYKIKIIWDQYESEIFQRVDNATSVTYNA